MDQPRPFDLDLDPTGLFAFGLGPQPGCSISGLYRQFGTRWLHRWDLGSTDRGVGGPAGNRRSIQRILESIHLFWAGFAVPLAIGYDAHPR